MMFILGGTVRYILAFALLFFAANAMAQMSVRTEDAFMVRSNKSVIGAPGVDTVTNVRFISQFVIPEPVPSDTIIVTMKNGAAIDTLLVVFTPATLISESYVIPAGFNVDPTDTLIVEQKNKSRIGGLGSGFATTDLRSRRYVEIFSDNFNRDDGALGSPYFANVEISGNRLGQDSSSGTYAYPLSGTTLVDQYIEFDIAEDSAERLSIDVRQREGDGKFYAWEIKKGYVVLWTVNGATWTDVFSVNPTNIQAGDRVRFVAVTNPDGSVEVSYYINGSIAATYIDAISKFTASSASSIRFTSGYVDNLSYGHVIVP